MDQDAPAPLVSRFAPSPTGRMHAGNLLSYLVCWIVVRRTGGRIALRIEDLDPARSKQAYADQIMADLELFGLTWDDGPFYQSDRSDLYRSAYEKLERQGLVYPCFCTRADLHAASAPHEGEAPVYPGTCRGLSEAERVAKAQMLAEQGRAPAMRIATDDRTVTFNDGLKGRQRYQLDRDCGDFVVRRADGTFAYNLAVVADDADMGVTAVVRGSDLLPATAQQIYLQSLLGRPTPTYFHHPLFRAPDGTRIAKRNRRAQVEELLATHKTPEAVLGRIAHTAGMAETDDPITPEELLAEADFASFSATSAFTWI